MGLTAEKSRGSPDALLALAGREGCGRLRIFLGAAPGVGKTFAMLQAGRNARLEGSDVVIGIVETHKRAETEALVEGFEVLPRQPLPHHGQMMGELDLDAALARKPKLLLVDEYAHSNAEGSRHPKRWQDVDELLEAGIDVWTTLNVQHLESVKDVVQKITKIRVRETVPDGVFDAADEIILVDLPADELLKRLAEGKVYVQDTAARAVDNFFRADNLIALRELALRRAAERIDSDLLERMQGRAIDGPWAAGERILVCVGSDDISPRVVRQAKRLADQIGAPLIAVTLQGPDAVSGESAAAALRLAESLGAETKTLVGSDLVEELLRFAHFENITQIVVGRSCGGRLAELMGRSLSHELVRRAEEIAIHVVTGAGDAARLGRVAKLFGSARPRFGAPSTYVWSTLAVAGAAAGGRGLSDFVELPNVSMIFLLAVLFSAVRFGIGPAVLASLLSFLAYNFLFLEPLYTFTIARPHELLALFVFLGVAVLTSALAGQARNQARTAVARSRANRRLYEFTRRLSGLAESGAVAEAAVVEVHSDLGRSVVLLLPEAGDIALAASWPPDDALETAAMSAARWAYNKNERAGADTGTLPNVPWYFVPLRSLSGPIGVIGVTDVVDGVPLDPEARTLLETIGELTASALERARLAREIGQARAQTETERVRNTLLASISHDFRTPLASILGAATSLIDYGEKLPTESRADLLGQVKDEAEHLDGMVCNLLAITRVEADALELRRDWVDLREMLDRAVAIARRRGATQAFTVTTAPDLPFVQGDPNLLDQAIGNIVGNAVGHAGPAAKVALSAGVVEAGFVVIEVTDDGPGIATDMLPHVFQKFARGRTENGDGGEGSGLGLAIAKGIVEAHGGTITAESPVAGQRGARLSLRLPVGSRAE